MHCRGSSPLSQMLDSSLAPFRVSLKYHSDSGPINPTAIKVDQGFSSTPIVELSSDRIPFFNVCSKANIFCVSCQGPENKVSYTGKLRTCFDSLQIEK